MEKSVIIIGAGIAGLSAGCYCRMNGYETHIFEMDNNRAGGLCTSWNRKGYTINGCIHFLLGSRPEHEFYGIWKELGALQDLSMTYAERYMQFEDGNGNVFVFYTDIDRLESHMKDIAPEDTGVIEEFTNGIRSCLPYHMPVEKAPEIYNLKDYFKMVKGMLPFIGIMMKWRKISVSSFAKRFKNPLLREAFTEIIGGRIEGGGFLDLPMIGGLQQFAWFHKKVAAYPEGGSRAFAQAIQHRYSDLGGRLHFKSRVATILVENNIAVGIKLVDGTEHRGDTVISTADGHSTIFNMLGGRYLDDNIQSRYERLPVWPPLVHMTLGVSRTFDEIPPSVEGINFPLDPPIAVDGNELNRLTVQIYNFDSSLAPPGNTVLRVQFFSNFERWKKLHQDCEKYSLEKKRIADKIIMALDKRFPGLASRVEMYDVATPVTYERFTGNWQGSYQGWLVTPKTMGLHMRKSLPGLQNFYMAGQWVEVGGGLPAAAMSGRNVAQIICNGDKKRFVTTNP